MADRKRRPVPVAHPALDDFMKGDPEADAAVDRLLRKRRKDAGRKLERRMLATEPPPAHGSLAAALHAYRVAANTFGGLKGAMRAGRLAKARHYCELTITRLEYLRDALDEVGDG